MKFIKLYKYYVNNYEKSLVSLTNARSTRSKFDKFLSTLDYSETLKNQNLQSYLILPVQRIPRYVLLLQDLLETTPSDHEDYPNIKNALREMESLGDYINENKRHHEQINQILDIQAKLQKFPEETLVKPGRVFI